MAKLSSINKNERRKKLVQQNAAKYAKLKEIANDESRDETERLIARLLAVADAGEQVIQWIGHRHL